MAKEEIKPIDQDSIGHLEDARRGKARSFVMVCKGMSIVSLVVYHKGTVETATRQAKQAGSGQVYHGLIEGNGQDLCFKLATADGFETEPVKPLTLKAFLEEEADFKAKPRFEIVPTLDGSGDTSGQMEDEMARFTRRLTDLKPALDEAMGGAGDNAQVIKSQTAVAAAHARKSEFGPANQALDEVERLLFGRGESITKDTEPIPLPPPPPPLPPDRQVAAALRHLKPAITRALQAFPERQAEIKQLQLAAEQQLKASKLDDAAKSLAQLEKLLASLSSVSPDQADAFHEQWGAAASAWEGAVNSVKEQLAGLKSFLLQDEDEDLQAIGEFGLGAVTQKHLVPLTAALMELDASGPDQLKAAARRVRNLVGEFKKHLETSPLVTACDQNPFGVNVTIRQTLTPPLAELEKGLASVA